MENPTTFEKTNKVLGWILIIMAVGAVIALIAFTFFLDAIVKKGIVAVGPKLTQTTVTLDAVHISLLTGSAKMQGFVIGNPEGYKTKQAISVGTVAIGIDPFSITKNKIVIRSIKVESPDITFEGDPLSGNNLAKIRSNIVGVQKSGGPPGASTNAVATAPNKPGKKLEVDDFIIKGGKVHAIITGMSDKEITVQIPDVHLQNLGTDKNGITATDLSYRIIDAITAATVKAVVAAAAQSNLDGKNVQ